MRVSACTGWGCEEERVGTKPVAVLWNGGKSLWGCVEEGMLKSKLTQLLTGPSCREKEGYKEVSMQLQQSFHTPSAAVLL